MSTVVFWDVQHGHATTVTSSNSRLFVVDLGQGSYGSGSTFSPLVFLHNSGIRRLDHLIISQPHLDHIDDILNVELFDVRVMIRPAHLERSDIMNGIRNVDRPKYERYWDLNRRFVWPITPQKRCHNTGELRRSACPDVRATDVRSIKPQQPQHRDCLRGSRGQGGSPGRQ